MHPTRTPADALLSSATDAAGSEDLAQLRLETAARRFEQAPLSAWDFSLRIDGDRIVDTVGPWAVGTIENLPARGVPGLRWDARCMHRRERPDHFAALHRAPGCRRAAQAHRVPGLDRDLHGVLELALPP